MDSIKLEDQKEQEQEKKEKEECIKSAADLFNTLSKTIKTLKIYPDTSPLKKKFVTELTEKFHKFLDAYGNLTLSVKHSELLYGNKIVYSHPSKEENIAFKLYGDGIRELAFTEGLEEKEIFDFIDVISGEYKGEEGDEDTVTLLWEKDFKNIRYIVVDAGEDTEKRPLIPEKPLPSEEMKNALFRAYKSETGPELHGKTASDPASVESEIEQIYGKPFSEIFTLTQEEITKVRQEMEMEKGLDPVLELMDVLFHILQTESELDSFSEILSNIESGIKELILSGKYKLVIPILTTLKTFTKDENTFSPAHAQEAEMVIDSLGDVKFLNQITLSTNLSKTDDLDSLFTFITMLNSNAIIPVTSLIGALDQMKSRRLFCDALAILAKENMEPLFLKLEDKNWHVVRNIVYTLGRIKDKKAVSVLRKVKDHKEPRVRKEIVHTLAEISSDDAKKLLIDFFNDIDESIRVAALKNIATSGYSKAVPEILNIISGDRFEVKEVYEKKEFFETLGRLGHNDILPFLKDILMKRTRLFGKSKIEEQRLYAAHTLKIMATPEAREILREGSLSPDKGIRKICEDTLLVLEKGQI